MLERQSCSKFKVPRNFIEQEIVIYSALHIAQLGKDVQVSDTTTVK
jgi:hypothetical protein